VERPGIERSHLDDLGLPRRLVPQRVAHEAVEDDICGSTDLDRRG
jgi:hypothetical protein